jgi:hypothetical protein
MEVGSSTGRGACLQSTLVVDVALGGELDDVPHTSLSTLSVWLPPNRSPGGGSAIQGKVVLKVAARHRGD